jgi:glycosyltransferase involved in cell wall biosynthesis
VQQDAPKWMLPMDRPASMLPSLSIVTLTYNEASIIQTTLQQLIDVGEVVTDDLEVVVVLSEASSDGTNDLVRAWAERDPRIRTVEQPRAISGYGQAFRLGLAAATKEYIFQTDADGQFDYRDLVRAVRELPGYDYVHYNRANRKDSWERLVIGRCFYYLIRLSVRSPAVDFDAAFKLFKRSILDRFELNCRSGVLVPEFVIKANLVGAKMLVGSTEHQARLGGEPAWEVKRWWLPVTLPNFTIVLQNLADLLVLRREIQAFQRQLRRGQ